MQLAEYQQQLKSFPRRKRKYIKKKIPKALRETLWLHYNGKSFESKCSTTWCLNRINAYDFQAGHKIPECKGGATSLKNLVPICARCNLSMGSTYTFDEWCRFQGGIEGAQPILVPRKSSIRPATPTGSSQDPSPTPPPRTFLSWLFSCFQVPSVIAPAPLQQQARAS
jgi:hypothetical protein